MDDHELSREDRDDTPLQHMKPFGSGLRRRQIAFVRASSESPGTEQAEVPPIPKKSAAEMYLSLVLPKHPASTTPTSEPDQVCEICQLPLDTDPAGDSSETGQGRKHEASLAHQVCLTHSHPPSALDRSRMGLAVLRAQGWDPDSRSGLGSHEQGVQYPIKALRKDDSLGLGMKIPKNLEPKRAKVEKLDAKKSRRMAVEEKKRRDRLQQEFYGNPDLEKYLGGS